MTPIPSSTTTVTQPIWSPDMNAARCISKYMFTEVLRFRAERILIERTDSPALTAETPPYYPIKDLGRSRTAVARLRLGALPNREDPVVRKRYESFVARSEEHTSELQSR